MKQIISAVLIFVLTAFPVFADYKLTQQITGMGNKMTQEFTIYAKGVRKRSEGRMIMEGVPPQAAAMMAKTMPNFITLQQCDLKQTVTLSEPKRSYFIDYDDWSTRTPEQTKRRPNQKITVKGTMETSSVVTDSGKRQQMFGLTAKWLKTVRTFERSADSCDGKMSFRQEEEGWYVDLYLSEKSCEVLKLPPAAEGGCRPRLIVKSMQNPGFFLEGTSSLYKDGKLVGTNNLKTTALSTATLDQALFEIPQGWTEVDSMSELMPGFSNIMPETSATTVVQTAEGTKRLKTIAIDFFSGNASKLNQDELRNYISQKVSDAGMSGYPINSQADLAAGKYVNTIGVEIRKIKESGASKFGGLFGKVTGASDATKLGDSEAEIVVTIYGKDGKTVVAAATAIERVKGKADDAVKAGIDRVIGGLLEKIK